MDKLYFYSYFYVDPPAPAFKKTLPKGTTVSLHKSFVSASETLLSPKQMVYITTWFYTDISSQWASSSNGASGISSCLFKFHLFFKAKKWTTKPTVIYSSSFAVCTIHLTIYPWTCERFGWSGWLGRCSLPPWQLHVHPSQSSWLEQDHS